MNRKDQIINIVIETLRERNFRDDFSLTEIASKADIGKSTLYEYFKNKDEMLKFAMMKFMNDNIQQVLVEDNVDEMSFEELFKAQMTRILNAAQNSRAMLEAMRPQFMKNLPPEMRDEIQKTMEGIREMLQNRFMLFFEKGVKEGIVSTHLAPLDGVILTSLVAGSIMTYSDPRNNVELDVMVNKLFESVVKLGN